MFVMFRICVALLPTFKIFSWCGVLGVKCAAAVRRFRITSYFTGRQCSSAGRGMHGARREGGVPNGKLNLNMSAAPHTHTLPILRGVPSWRQTRYCTGYLREILKIFANIKHLDLAPYGSTAKNGKSVNSLFYGVISATVPRCIAHSI